jgi:ATP-dependent DNA helicase PIF1
MMSSKMFDLLDQIGRATRKCNGKPFGGIQLIFTGDFFQLPPIPDQGEPTSGEFCFQHPRWSATFKAANCIELRTFFRQTDPAYISILQEVRRGTISPANSDLLRTRLMRGRPSDKGDGIVPTKLFPVRSKFDTINESSYERLDGEERVYHFSVTTKAKTHIDTGTVLSAEETAHCEELTSEQLSREVDTLITSLFTEKTVRLKIGTLVMCTANIDVERGICNGSQGIVIGYADLVPSAVLPDELLRVGGKPISVPLVRFSNGVTMKVAPHQRQSEEYPCIIVAQIPLCLAWALTIHKIQGATLDMAEMDIGRSIFADGQSYVALSRVKTLEGLNLSEFNATKIKANTLVVEFYDSFPKIGEDEMLSEIGAILSKFSVPIQPSTLKQASMQSFTITKESSTKESSTKESSTKESSKESSKESTQKANPFSAFESKDPTIKTVILSKY